MTANGSTYAQKSNNLLRSGGAGDIVGIPTFVGGVAPTTYAGFELAAGSVGKRSGVNPAGSDIGITVVPVSTAPLQAPSNLRIVLTHE